MSFHHGDSAAKEFIYQGQVQTLSPKSNITMMNVFTHIGLLYNLNGQVCSMFTFLGFVFILSPYCLAVNAQWIGSFIFINNVFSSWCFCFKWIYSSSPGSNPVTKIKYYYDACVHIGSLYIHNGQVCIFTFLGFVFIILFPYCLALNT